MKMESCLGYCGHCHNTAECQCVTFGTKPYYDPGHDSACVDEGCSTGYCLLEEERLHLASSMWNAMSACCDKMGWYQVEGDIAPMGGRIDKPDNDGCETLQQARRDMRHLERTLKNFTEMMAAKENEEKPADRWDMDSTTFYTGGWFTRQIMKHVERFFDFYAIDSHFVAKFQEAKNTSRFAKEVEYHPLFIHGKPEAFRGTFEKLVFLEENQPRLFRPLQCLNLKTKD